MKIELNEYDEMLAQEKAEQPFKSRVQLRQVDNDYAEAMRQGDDPQKLREQMVRATMLGGTRTDPDRFAEAKRLERRTGIPASMIERNLESVRQRAQLNEYDQLLESSPVTAKSLVYGGAAFTGHDDVANLSMTEKLVGSFKRGLKGTLRGGDASSVVESAEILNVIDRVENGELQDDVALAAQTKYASMFAGVGRSPENLARMRAATEARLAENAVEYSRRGGELSAMPTSSDLGAFQRSTGWRDAFSKLADAPLSIAGQVSAESMGALLPYIPAVVGSGAAGGVRGLAAATGASSFSVEYAGAVTEILTKLNVDVNDQRAVQAAVRTPEFAALNRQALIKAGIIGAVDAATAGTMGTRLARSAAGNLAAQTGVQMAGGAAGEVLGSVASGQEVNPAAVLSEMVGEGPTAVIDAATLGGRKAVQRASQAREAQHNARVLADVTKAAKDSKLRARDPEAFAQHVEAAAEYGPVQEVYISAEALQQSGVDLQKLAAVSPAVAAQLPEVMAAQGDIALTMAEYATQVAPTEFSQALVPHLRTSVDAMSETEAQTFMQSDPADEVKRAVEQQAKQDQPQPEGMAAVREQILDQLAKANRFTPDVNRSYADLGTAFVGAMAQRMGLTPAAFAQQYPLNIVSQVSALDENVLSQQRKVPSHLPDPEVVDAAEELVRFAAQFEMTPDQLVEAFKAKPPRSNTAYGEFWKKFQPNSSAAQFMANNPERLPDARKQLDAYFTYQADKDTARGQLSFSKSIKERGAVLALFERADLSTFIHESGHFYLEVLANIASNEGAPADVTRDMQVVLDWFGVKDIATWRGMNIDQKRTHHEQFARGFEAYTFEGKAPSIELQGLFNRFRSWMLRVYKQLTSLNVELTDEVRSVFDRMLASGDEIKIAETARSYRPLFESAAEAGMSPDDWVAYQALGANATQTAVDDLQRRSLRDMRWLSNAKSRALRELQQDANDKRKAVRAEVEAEVMADPVQRVKYFLARGKLPLGEEMPDDISPVKLSLPALKEMYGTEHDAPWRHMAFGEYGLASNEGVHPDVIAEAFGFSSGDEIVRKMLAAEKPGVLIEGMTDQRMLERYGDLSSDEAVERAAEAAIHNDLRARTLEREVGALAKATGNKPVLARAARAFAEQSIAQKKMRDVRPAQYSHAEARAARNAEAAFKKGDTVAAATEKRNQLLNHALARVAHEARTEQEKHVAYLRRFNNDTTRAAIGPDYIEQIDQLLENIDLRKAVSKKEADRRKSLVQWVEAQRELGFEPTFDNAKMIDIAGARRLPYREMSLEELRGIVDTIKNIEHLGRLKNKLLTAQDERAFQDAAQDMIDSIVGNATKTIAMKIESNLPRDNAGNFVSGFLTSHRKTASIVRQMDGVKDGGAVWQRIVRPMNAAGDREAAMREKATIELSKIFETLTGDLTKTKRFIPEINASLTKGGRLAIALNQGNETNRQRVMQGDGWTGEQVNAILKTLTAADWQFVQAVWDHIDSYWPEIEAKEQRVSGVANEKVQASAFTVTTADGSNVTLRGGYYPIKYDSNRSSRSEADNMAEIVKQSMQGLYTRATTRRGHTKARVDEVLRPVRKDLGVIFEHVGQVVHDLSWHEFLIDANRLIRHKGVDAAVRKHYGTDTLRALSDALTDIAAGDIPAQNHFERGLNHLRTGATIAGLGWNVMTSLLQPLGLTQSMVRIGPKWVGRGIAHWLGDAARMESTVASIHARSDFMRLRGKTMQREINEIRNTVSGKGQVRTVVEESYFYLIQKMQMVADVPTWLGQYAKAIEHGADEATAIAQADQAVLDSQGGGQIKDLAAIQRGGPLLKLWTNFYSYFNTTFNLTAESVARTSMRDPLSVGRLAVDLLLLYTLPAVLGATMKSALKGEDDDLDELAPKLAREQLNYMLGMMVGVRELGAAVSGTFGYSGPAGTRFFSEITKLGKQAGDGEIDGAVLDALNGVAGVVFHYPAGQVERIARGLEAVASGDAGPQALLFGPPKE